MKFNKNWFTLIELIIAMTIFFIIVTMTYANYAYYQNIARVKLSLKEISQSINQTKNMALNWYDKAWINQSIWVFFQTGSNIIKFYRFNHGSWIIKPDDTYLIKEEKLQEHVIINDISWKDNMMIYFSAIIWTGSMYYFDSTWKHSYTGTWLDIGVSFKNATNFPLKRTLQYYMNTNMIDY